ncbi:MAG: hypothetical protein IPI06_05715 [Gammaproteobacteria bacterium]|nr:hypothetical protein [Gammaproteobacteria bacterium]
MNPAKPPHGPVDPAAARERTAAAEGPGARADWIGDGLRQLYRRVTEEPLPEAFAKLLAQLDEEDSSAAGVPAVPDDAGSN